MEQLALTFAALDVDLSVRSFSIEEGINHPFEVSVMAYTSSQQQLELDRVLGLGATFKMAATTPTAPYRGWTGVCTHFDLVDIEPTGQALFYIRIVPDMARMRLRQNSRIFQHMTALDIVTGLLAEWKIECELWVDRAEYPKFEYRVQYEETDFAFVNRMLEEAGVSYFFLAPDLEAQGPTAQSRLVLCDKPQFLEPRVGLVNYFNDSDNAVSPFIIKTKIASAVRPGTLTMRDYDFRTRADFELMADAKQAIGLEERYETFQYRPGAFRIEKGDRVLSDTEEASALATRRLEANRFGRRYLTYRTSAFDLSPGTVFGMANHPRPELDERARLLVVRQRIEGQKDQRWTSRGEAVFSSDPYRPALATPKPRVGGVQSAIVVGPDGEEIHTDEHGRVRVQFHWDRYGSRNAHSSCFIRVSHAWAGKSHGFTALPRIGDEVLVDFFEGDPDQPIIVGRVFNGSNRHPATLPENLTKTIWRSNSSPGGEGYNEISFEDRKGRELLHIRAENNLDKLVKGAETVQIGETLTTEIRQDEDRRVGGSQTVEVGANRSSTVRGSESVTVGGDYSLATNRETGAIVQRDGTVMLTNGQASIVLSGPNIYFDARENIRITAGQVAALFGGEVHIDGRPNVLINATAAPAPSPAQMVPYQGLVHPAHLDPEEEAFQNQLLEHPSVIMPPESINAQLQGHAAIVGKSGLIYANLMSKAELANEQLKAKLALAAQKADQALVDLRARVEAAKGQTIPLFDELLGRSDLVLARTQAELERIKARVTRAWSRVESAKANIEGRVDRLKNNILSSRDNLVARFDRMKEQVAAVPEGSVKGWLKKIEIVVKEGLAMAKDLAKAVKQTASDAKALVTQIKTEYGLIKEGFEGAVDGISDGIESAVADIKDIFAGGDGVNPPLPPHEPGHPPHPPHPPHPAHPPQPAHPPSAPHPTHPPQHLTPMDAHATKPLQKPATLANSKDAMKGLKGSGYQADMHPPMQRGVGDRSLLDQAKDAGGKADGDGRSWLDDAKGAGDQANGGGSQFGQGSNLLSDAKGAGDGVSGQSGQGLGFLEQAQNASNDAGGHGSSGLSQAGGIPTAQSPLADNAALTRSGGFGGQEMGQAINNTRGATFLQSPGEGQLMIVRTDSASPLDPAVLQDHVVDGQMRGVNVSDSLGDHLAQNGYEVYERPWGNYSDGFVKRAAAAAV